MTKHILIIAGEISGDLYGASLAHYFQKDNIKVSAIGGDQLKKKADVFLLNMAKNNHIGLKTVFHKGKVLKIIKQSLETLKEKPQAAVLIDFQHLNKGIAALLQELNIPIHTYITPNFWLYSDNKNAKKVMAYSKSITTIFKNEAEYYKNLGAKPQYFGHPLTEMIKSTQEKREHIIALMPGSRQQEMTQYLNVMINALPLIKDISNYAIYILLSDNCFKEQIDKAIINSSLDISYWKKDKESLLKQSKLALVASGSATIECSIHKTPMVILAALPKLTYVLAKYILRLKMPYITLPNYLTNTLIFPEIVQSDLTPRNIADASNEVLELSSEECESKFLTIFKYIQKEKNPIQKTAEFIRSEL